jgi:hypothetical protein
VNSERSRRQKAAAGWRSPRKTGSAYDLPPPVYDNDLSLVSIGQLPRPNLRADPLAAARIRGIAHPTIADSGSAGPICGSMPYRLVAPENRYVHAAIAKHPINESKEAHRSPPVSLK